MSSIIDLFRPFLTNISDPEALVNPFLTRQSVVKHKELIQPGNVCRNVYYIRQGACYKYRLIKGQFQVAQFYTAGDLATDFQSFLFQRPAEFYVKVQSKLDLDVLSYSALQELYNRHHQVERMGRLLIERKIDELIGIFWSLRQDNPEVRYLKLIEQRPDVIEQFPQFLIASYLGITPVGLSKIRKRLTTRYF